MVRKRSNAKVYPKGDICNSGKGKSECSSSIFVAVIGIIILSGIFEADLSDDTYVLVICIY